MGTMTCNLKDPSLTAALHPSVVIHSDSMSIERFLSFWNETNP